MNFSLKKTLEKIELMKLLHPESVKHGGKHPPPLLAGGFRYTTGGDELKRTPTTPLGRFKMSAEGMNKTRVDMQINTSIFKQPYEFRHIAPKVLCRSQVSMVNTKQTIDSFKSFI
jgi:hypothetical protein